METKQVVTYSVKDESLLENFIFIFVKSLEIFFVVFVVWILLELLLRALGNDLTGSQQISPSHSVFWCFSTYRLP